MATQERVMIRSVRERNLAQMASLLGQPVGEVRRASHPLDNKETLFRKNEKDITEAIVFRNVLEKIGKQGDVSHAYYPGAGADLIPDQILFSKYKIPVYKTSHPREFDEFSDMIPSDYRQTYSPATFGETELPIAKADLIILRNIPLTPGIWKDIEKYRHPKTLLIRFEKDWDNRFKEMGLTQVTGEYLSSKGFGVEIYK